MPQLNLNPITKPIHLTPKPHFTYHYPPPYTHVSQAPQLRDMRAFEDIHLFDDYRIKRYIDFPRANFSATSSEAAISELREAVGLSANNAEARIAFTRAVIRHLTAHAGVQVGSLHMVTLNPRRFAFRVGDEGVRYRHLGAAARMNGEAAAFKVRSLQGLARQSLPGIDFVGMVEAALFKGWGPDGPFFGDWISWHCHLLVWGATRAEIQTALARLRLKEHAFYCHGSVADVREFARSELIAKVVYSLKAPIKHYRVGHCENEWCSERTGEIRPPGWRVNKDWMRPGDRVRLLDVFVGRNLDSLFFGGGAGTTLARAIRADARRLI